MSGLRLDNARDALKGSYSGPVITPGDSAGSKFIRVLTRPESEGPVMPLGGERLPPEQIALLAAWVDQGAVWPDAAVQTQQNPKEKGQWSFLKPARPAPPKVGKPSSVRNPIDQFVKARLAAEGLEPARQAPKATLLRRVSLDLIGLPPTPAEVDRFISGGESYDAAVDRLLASPHFGEKQALHWLDQARFGESDGYQADYVRPHAWRWRHWVIEAFNRNMGFDQFTIEQIAGDLLPEATVDQRLATGFHRNALHNREGGFPLEMDRVERNVDRASTVATVWLGLTAGCARCHDHKFDPITQKDFYSLYGFFDTSVEHNIDAPLPGELDPYLASRPEYERRRDELFSEYKIQQLQAYWEKNILQAAKNPDSDLEPVWKVLWDLLLFEIDGGTEAVETPQDQRTARQDDLLSDYFVGSVAGGYDLATTKGYEDVDFKELKTAYAALREEFPELTKGYTIIKNPEPRQTRILVRGDYRNPGIPVEPDALSALPPLPPGKADRLALGRWLVSSENPLTARVAVNRIWQQYFGAGLVSTPEDFGTRGKAPSHPALLDWLAVEFMENGWDVKALHRLIVTSATYRQSSDVRPELLERDTDNRLLARQSRFRLAAEIIRDTTLAAAGLLDTRIGGRSVRPFLPKGATEIGFGDFVKWPQSTGGEQYRRGLYIFRQRTLPYPQLETFDAPDTVHVNCKRETSTTPLQALTLLNDPVFVEAAAALARRLPQEGSVRERIEYGFRLCLARGPSPSELDRLLQYHDQQLPIVGEKATWEAVSSVLLNLTEFLTRT